MGKASVIGNTKECDMNAKTKETDMTNKSKVLDRKTTKRDLARARALPEANDMDIFPAITEKQERSTPTGLSREEWPIGRCRDCGVARPVDTRPPVDGDDPFAPHPLPGPPEPYLRDWGCGWLLCEECDYMSIEADGATPHAAHGAAAVMTCRACLSDAAPDHRPVSSQSVVPKGYCTPGPMTDCSCCRDYEHRRLSLRKSVIEHAAMRNLPWPFQR